MAEEVVRFCIRCGTPVTIAELYGRMRPTCPACGWIYFADPKVAAAVLVEENGQVLLVRRINEPFRGYWSLPAGFINADEDPAEAAARECLEETGLEIHILDLLTLVAGKEHPRGADFIIVYRAEMSGGELHPGDDADRAGFFAPDQLPPLAFRATQVAIQKWLENRHPNNNR